MRYAPHMLMLLVLATPVTSQPDTPWPVVVSPQWLQEHRNDPDLVVLHAAFNRRDYAREHIPGARFIWTSWLSPSTPDASTEMAPLSDAVKVVEELGLSPTSKIVVYFTGTALPMTTRTIYALMYYGFEGRVALLDGGFDAWKRAGGPVSGEALAVSPTVADIRPRPELLADAEFVRRHLNDPAVTIVDARARSFYDGSGTGARPGHIKGAVHLGFSTIVDSLNRIKDMDELERIFREAGIKKGNTVVAYCHVGQQATVVLLAARILGHPVRLYDGSYEEWPHLDEVNFPVEPLAPSDDP